MADTKNPSPALSGRQQRLLDRASAALQSGQFDYAVDSANEVLAEIPSCVSALRTRHAAQLRAHQSRSSLLARMRSRLGLVRLNLKTEIAAARFAAAERLLVLDPTNWRALVALGEAATELGWVEAAVFAREAIAELRPDDQENLLAFGEALLAAGQPGAALVVAEKILARHPIDGAGLELLRHASIALTVETGNWEK